MVITLPPGGHGFGSYLHHIVIEGLILAYSLNRTLVLTTPTGSKYGPGVWEKYMLPLSETCVTAPEPTITTSGGKLVFSEYRKNLKCIFGKHTIYIYNVYIYIY